jgi:hypothetical protein
MPVDSGKIVDRKAGWPVENRLRKLHKQLASAKASASGLNQSYFGKE